MAALQAPISSPSMVVVHTVVDTNPAIPLRVHVPKYYILWPQCTYIGTTLGPMYILYEYMDP